GAPPRRGGLVNKTGAAPPPPPQGGSGAGDLDPPPIRPVGSGPRAVAATPSRQPPQRSSILCRLRDGGDEAGKERERVRQRHSRSKTGSSCGRVDRGEQPPTGSISDRGEWELFSRRGGVFPIRQAQPVDRPARQPEIHD